MSLPDYLKSGEPARLFPIVSETSKEKRIASVLLAMLTQIPEMASSLLAGANVRVGTKTEISVYTEIVLKENGASSTKDRPDGLIVVRTSKKEWRALVEAKIGKSVIEEDQLRRYLDIARSNQIDAVITISNQFVARADHHPISRPKILVRRVGLYHWPWMWIATQANLIHLNNSVTDNEQRYLLNEFIRLIDHPSTGVEAFTQMPKEWKDVVGTVFQHGKLKKKSDSVESVVSAWHQEIRDLCLQLSRHIGSKVELKLPTKFQNDPVKWLDEGCAQLADAEVLSCSFQVPNTVGNIDVSVDLRTRSITCNVRLRAPEDRKSTKARLNWLLRQLEKSQSPKISIGIIRPRRAANSNPIPIAELRENPGKADEDNPTIAATAFDIKMIHDLAGKFIGSRRFIEELELIVPEFYDEVIQYLREWQAPPPKPLPRSKTAEEEVGDIPLTGPDPGVVEDLIDNRQNRAKA